MTAVEVFAPAKINLTLHVTGQRADGYHLLDSVVAFAGVGDVLRVTAEGPGGLTVTGPFAAEVPTDGANLVLKVAQALASGRAFAFCLDKRLPVASGIGGGSADAGAAVRALRRLDPEAPHADLARLGADIPVCAFARPARVGGIGDIIEPLAIPPLPILLVNPGIPVPTAGVFAALECRANSAMEPPPEDLADVAAVFDWLARGRNDLQAPALRLAPAIGAVFDAIAGTEGCVLARMSGSGATCFGLYDTADNAEAAATRIAAARPDWWVRATRLDGHTRAAPKPL